MKRILIVVFLVLITSGIANGVVMNTKHDLTATKNTIRAQDFKITSCQFCHTPHLQASSSFAGAPMWNRKVPTTSYSLYGGEKKATTAGTSIKQPGPTSLACLSCHDGTLSIVDVLPGTGADAGQPKQAAGYVDSGGKLISAEHGLVGTDLSKQHPVGFKVNPNVAGLAPLETMKQKKAAFYRENGGKAADGDYMECGTCHDPHESRGAYAPFLRLPKLTICTDCHSGM